MNGTFLSRVVDHTIATNPSSIAIYSALPGIKVQTNSIELLQRVSRHISVSLSTSPLDSVTVYVDAVDSIVSGGRGDNSLLKVENMNLCIIVQCFSDSVFLFIHLFFLLLFNKINVV